jgi:hypothetical protein
LAASDIQRLLSGDEALVAFSVGDKESYVFALTHDGAAWHKFDLRHSALAERVARFRQQPATPSRVEAMRAKIKAGGHASAYGLRKQLPEPAFGQIKQARVFRLSAAGLRERPRRVGKDPPPRSTVHDYRIHHAPYVECREQSEREAQPAAAIIGRKSSGRRVYLQIVGSWAEGDQVRFPPSS